MRQLRPQLDLVRCVLDGLVAAGRRSTLGRWRTGRIAASNQVEAYRQAWQTHNRAAFDGPGPLWVVLGDPAA